MLERGVLDRPSSVHRKLTTDAGMGRISHCWQRGHAPGVVDEALPGDEVVDEALLGAEVVDVMR